MKINSFWLLAFLPGVTVTFAAPANAAQSATAKAATHTNPPNRLPPVGIEIPAAARHALEQELHELESAGTPLAQDPLWADISELLKAVRYALVDGEFYVPKDVEKAKQLLQLAESRLADLKKHQPRWTTQTGTLVRGFISGIDGTPQPIGLEIPADLDLSKPVPLTVWLHGRGDKVTDMHFIDERMHKPGQFQPGGCITLHPFGRQCLGYQLAGEADVLEAIEAVKRMYRIDDRRILLAGFSMGGAGAWHVGAHYADHWCGLHAGAGFVEVKRFLNLTPARFPPVYTQTLWGQYDVPACVRNLFNIPVLAYSGEVDKQKLAADIMAEAFQAEGQKLHQLVGPGMGQKYHPEVLKEIEAWSHERMQEGQPVVRRAVHWQGRTLKYPRMFWLGVLGLQRHWEDSRVDADWEGSKLKVTTKNVTRFWISPTLARHDLSADVQATVNGQSVAGTAPGCYKTPVLKDGQRIHVMSVELKDGLWQLNAASAATAGLYKVPDLQGPIDDAFTTAFIVVPPDKVSSSAVREAFYQRELAYTVRRWREVFRGDLPVKRTSDLTADDLETKNVILFGEPDTNSKMAELLAQTPIAWQSNELKLGSRSWKGESIVPLAIYPNPKQPGHYIVLNSGPTIRDKSDSSNSLQTPQLPDWAVLDVSGQATDSTAAKILEAGFFNEQWLP
jgi:predicted esterase